MTPHELSILDQCRQALLKPGKDWFDYQLDAFDGWVADTAAHPKQCLYFKTGAGKTATSLTMMKLSGVTDVIVMAPPITHEKWVASGAAVGIKVTAISHALFRGKNFKMSRSTAIIVDEMHLLGGHSGRGWKKLDRLAPGLEAPLIIMSATPNYNDADRVYCVSHLCDPFGTKGGYEGFLFQHCVLEPDPFSRTPKVLGFHRYANAAEFLGDLPYVHYLPDDIEIEPTDIELYTPLPWEFVEYGLDLREGRMVASQMEGRHATDRLQRIGDDGLIRLHIMDELDNLVGSASTPTLVFAFSSRIGNALYATVRSQGIEILTGADTTARKSQVLNKFIDGKIDVLIGTATLATGPDGMDTMCDNLVILHDTDDDSLRRQLIGRILPRGDYEQEDLDKKTISRIVMTS